MYKISSSTGTRTIYAIICIFFLVSFKSYSQEKELTNIELSLDEWTSVSKQEGDILDPFSFDIVAIDGGIEFTIDGTPGASKTVSWTREIEDIKLDDFSYIVIDYLANRLNNPIDRVIGAIIENDNGSPREITLLKTLDLIDDGRRHRLIIKNTESGLLNKMEIRMNSRSSHAFLRIKSIKFLKSEREFSSCIRYTSIYQVHDTMFHIVDLPSPYDINFIEAQKSMLEEYPSQNDGGKYFSDALVEVEKIPFNVGNGAMNLLSFPAESVANEDSIEHFGHKVKRLSVAPISRDNVIDVEVNTPVTEVYFLLGAANPRICRANAGYLTYIVEDIEAFAVELVYEDGTIDFAFPYSVRDQSHIIQGTFGLYAVPASGKPLKKIVFHNRTYGKEFYLGAVTINQRQSRLYPKLIEEPGPKPTQLAKISDPPEVSPYLTYQEGMLKVGNSFVEMTIDAGKSFTITEFTNKWLGENSISLSPTPGFQIEHGNKNVSLENVELLSVSEVKGKHSKEITLHYGLNNAGIKLDFSINVSVSHEPEIGMQLIAVNKTENDLKAKVVFPILSGVQMGMKEDMWYYYPSYRNVFSNQNVTFDHIYSLSFPLQFYDVFNPTLGGGFYLATRETDVNEMRRYGLKKDEDGMKSYIEYPQLHTLLKSNVPFAFCKTVLGVHKEDWHVPFNTYKKWLATWYKAVKSQDKQWYKECFWLLCEYPDNIPYDLLFMHRNFTWYDTLNNHYRMLDILEEHKQTVGRNPDILHFWCWQQNMPDGYKRWGSYGANGEYEKLGGVENFRNAIGEIKNTEGVNVSIYIDASLCNRDIPIAKKIGPGAAMQLEGGGPVIDYQSYRMCPGAKPWREYMKNVYKRVNKELDVSILYVDEWAPPMYNGHIPLPAFTCHSADHGHEVPANLNLEVNTYMRELRKAVPEKAALYGEYPDVDVNTKFYDSNINYYLSTYGTELKDGRDNIAYDLESRDIGFSDPYMNLHRFVFPGLVQLVLPNDAFNYSWNRLKFTFLNGDAVYDNFWVRDESKAEAFMIKSHDIKLEYVDCFTTKFPEPMVDTEISGILGNKFPGKDRTLWTIYNQRYTTVRGEIMKVKHIEGASYYDVWNDKPLPVKISNGMASISMELHPQAIGCFVQIIPVNIK